MRRISINSNRNDLLTVRVGRDRSRMAVSAVAFAVVTTVLFFIDRQHPLWLVSWFIDLALLPVVGITFFRSARRSERTLVRSTGRLLLDGEPIEMARLELRVMKMPITRMPTGYALSLWVMTAVGPEDLPIGHSRTLLEASMLSGQIEEFVQRANVKQHRHV